MFILFYFLKYVLLIHYFNLLLRKHSSITLVHFLTFLDLLLPPHVIVRLVVTIPSYLTSTFFINTLNYIILIQKLIFSIIKITIIIKMLSTSLMLSVAYRFLHFSSVISNYDVDFRFEIYPFPPFV